MNLMKLTIVLEDLNTQEKTTIVADRVMDVGFHAGLPHGPSYEAWPGEYAPGARRINLSGEALPGESSETYRVTRERP